MRHRLPVTTASVDIERLHSLKEAVTLQLLTADELGGGGAQQKVLDTINKKSNLASDPPPHPPTPLKSAIWALKIADMILYNYIIIIIEPLWVLTLLLRCCTKC
jgi:hypothetical protein